MMYSIITHHTTAVGTVRYQGSKASEPVKNDPGSDHQAFLACGAGKDLAGARTRGNELSPTEENEMQANSGLVAPSQVTKEFFILVLYLLQPTSV